MRRQNVEQEQREQERGPSRWPQIDRQQADQGRKDDQALAAHAAGERDEGLVGVGLLPGLARRVPAQGGDMPEGVPGEFPLKTYPCGSGAINIL